MAVDVKDGDDVDRCVELDKRVSEDKTDIDGNEMDINGDKTDICDGVDNVESEDGIIRSVVVADGDNMDVVMVESINDLVIITM